MDYRCWFLINQTEKEREFKDIEDSASSIFADFINQSDYGQGIGLFRFDIYVAQTINYGLHHDSVYSGCAHLTANVDYKRFIEGDRDTKIKILLNASLILIKYLGEKLVLPKDIRIDEMKIDYEKFLESKLLLMNESELNLTVLKVFNSTKFNFRITTTYEVKDSEIHYDLNDIEDFINNELTGKTFGSSIRQFDLGYEIFDFKGDFAESGKKTAGYKRYGTKYKNLLVVKQFDYGKIKLSKPLEQFQTLKVAILEAIRDVELLNKRPKDFDGRRFYDEMKRILNDYEINTGHNII